MALTDRQLAYVRLIEERGCKYPQTTVEEAVRVGIPLSYALAFLEQESSGTDRGRPAFGLNLFGHDAVANPVRGGVVTASRYATYLANRRQGMGMQGVGPCQLTWWEFQDRADKLGGCWRPRYNMRVGFALAKSLIRQHGVLEGVARYNGTGPAARAYAQAWRERQRRWHALLDGDVPASATGADRPAPTRREPATRPLCVRDPLMHGRDVRALQKGVNLLVAEARRIDTDAEYGQITDRVARVCAWRIGVAEETLREKNLSVGVQRLLIGLAAPAEEHKDRAAQRRDRKPPATFEPPPTDDASVLHRWESRLRARKRLLRDAEADLAAAKTDAERKAAQARVKLRRQQVADAKRVIERHEVAKSTVRERVVRAAMLGYKHAPQIDYSQSPSRWQGIARKKRAHRGEFPTVADCSSFATWCIWDALGGPSAGPDIVNGSSWTAGYTGTQTSHGRQVPLSRARPGDLAFYANSSGINHVAIVVAPGRVVSHGSPGGPYLVDIAYREVAQVRSYLPD
jgi:cell wall-associated NlpC family hydrolase